MAARANKGTRDIPWSEQTRDRIKTSMLIKELEKHILGKREMATTQVTAALGLLRKTLPDLAASEHRSEQTVTFVMQGIPEAPTEKQWLEHHAPPSLQ